jgi:hypothetical protein
MNEQAWRWIAAAKKGESATDDEGKEFIRFIESQLWQVARSEDWFIVNRSYITELAYEFIERLLDDKFRPHWRHLPPADIQRLACDDLYNEFLSTVRERYVHRRATECYSAELPEQRFNYAGEPLPAKELVAVRRYHCDHEAVLRNDAPADFCELPYAAVEEAHWRTFKRCLTEYRRCEWPESWLGSNKALVAHVLLWYERNPPEFDLKNFELAEVLGLSSAVAASKVLRSARIARVPRPEAPADGVSNDDEWTYWQAVLSALRNR